MQTHGHLEWLLKHEEYSSWRENDQVNEVCPQHPAVLPALLDWLDEVIKLHPQSTFVHVGGDETWHLATCPLCCAVADASPHVKLSVYLSHCHAICEHVIARGKRPMLWADAFWPEEARELVKELPPEVLLIDWQYGWLGPTEITAELDSGGREVWAASAIRCAYDQKFTLAPIGERSKNIAIWRPQLDDEQLRGVLHTFWNRSGSQGRLYGPWEGWLPGFIAAAELKAWSTHALYSLVDEMDAAMKSTANSDEVFERLRSVESNDHMTQRCVQWWILSLRHKDLFYRTVESTLGYGAFEAVHHAVGTDPFRMKQLRQNRADLRHDIDAWDAHAREFWQHGEWTDADEYLGSRIDNLRKLLQCDWRYNT